MRNVRFHRALKDGSLNREKDGLWGEKATWHK